MNSKDKGNSFERVCCRLLTKWATGTEKPEVFWRSASSGAQATQSRKRGVKSKMGGDIVAIDAAGQFFTDLFSIECKSYKDFDFSEYFKDTKGEIKQWWKQCCEDAEAANKLPFLIFKKNNSPSYVKTSIDVFSILVDLYGKVPSPNIVISGKEVIFLFSDFLLLDSEPLKAYNRGSNV